ncbi:hypothetical protein [Pseudorhodoferax sp. Leaf274]|uniref:hypothetical protein n=1 Tax=Pseudorhodoferax sp. Leaf274 TaxID=1736318 RepID=UPI0012E11D96|nr:hypothetical protein [Pseudorhodoferax sp. Leaf274]
MTTKNKGGRPRLSDDERLIPRTISMNAAAWERVDLYGYDWMRERVAKGTPPKDWKPPAESVKK